MARRDNYNRYTQPYLPPQSGGNSVYQPVYDPNETAMMADLMTKRQQRFDTSRANLSQFQGQVGGVQTYAPDALQSQLDNFSTRIKDMVDTQYNGDYGLAAGDISEMIATEKANPFYKMVSRQNEEAKRIQQAQQKYGKDLIITNDPRSQGALEESYRLSQLPQDERAGLDPYSGITAGYTERDDYLTNTSKQFNKFIPNISDSVFKSFSEGLKKDTTVKQITEKRLDKTIEQGVDTWLENNKSYALENKDLTPKEVRQKAKDYIKGNIIDEVFSQVNQKVYGDPNAVKAGEDNIVNPYDTTGVLPVNSSRYKTVEKEYNEFSEFDYTKEPEKEFTQTIKDQRGIGRQITEVSKDWKDWNSKKEKYDKYFDSNVIPYMKNIGNLNIDMDKIKELPPEQQALAKQELTKSYLETKKHAASTQENYKTISYDAATDINKIIKDQGLSRVDNFVIDGQDVSPDKIFKELGDRNMGTEEMLKRMKIVGKDSQGRFVAKFRTDKGKGYEDKTVRFYPSEESKKAFSPIKKIMENYTFEKNEPGEVLKPMKFTENGKTWLVDFVNDGEKIVPRIIKGNSKEIDGINSNNPYEVSNYINQIEQSQPEAIFDLQSASDETYNTYNNFYDTYTGKK